MAVVANTTGIQLSLTPHTTSTDNGSEFFGHEYITKKLGIKVYFADPYAPWQKGGIENTNGLIRQYIPNGTDFWGRKSTKN